MDAARIAEGPRSIGDVATVVYDMQNFAYYNANRELTLIEVPPRVTVPRRTSLAGRRESPDVGLLERVEGRDVEGLREARARRGASDCQVGDESTASAQQRSACGVAIRWQPGAIRA